MYRQTYTSQKLNETPGLSEEKSLVRISDHPNEIVRFPFPEGSKSWSVPLGKTAYFSEMLKVPKNFIYISGNRGCSTALEIRLSITE